MSEWNKTNGDEPDDYDWTDWLWVRWDNGQIDLIECYGSIAWNETTHWMPAEIERPEPPK